MEDTAFVKRILIECPIAIKNAHPLVSADHYETINSKIYLRLHIGRGKYTPIEDEIKADFIYTGTGTVAPLAISKRGFDAVCDYADSEVLSVVRHIAQNCTANNLRTFTPVEILDFLAEPNPRPGDRRVLDGEFYTRWLGRIVSISPKGQSIGYGSTQYGEGFSLKFKEVDRNITL